MENVIKALDWILPKLIYVFGFTLMVTLIILPFFLIPWLHKRINLLEVKKIKEEQRQINEEAHQIVFDGKMGDINRKTVKATNEAIERLAILEKKIADAETELETKTKK